ncbi:MAG: methyltransferase domain-containing protein [Betaproteobacteria bacterium]|nr:methyltransferase domain-containing protein [Betaproteobacteria bacterium]
MNVTGEAIDGTRYRIVDENGYRYLMVQGDDSFIMSTMQFAEPDALVSRYTKNMMKLLVFKPHPRDMVLIGLGGGQQAKFVHGRMPDTRLVAVEIDPAMVRIAREYFGVPPDDERLSVVVGEGGAYIFGHPDSCDVILSDGYDQDFTLHDSLSVEDFYHACHRALRAEGIMAVNLHRKTRAWCDAHMSMVSKIFAMVMAINTSDDQIVLMMFKSLPEFGSAALAERAQRLEQRYGLGLPEFAREFSEAYTKGSRQASDLINSAPSLRA